MKSKITNGTLTAIYFLAFFLMCANFGTKLRAVSDKKISPLTEGFSVFALNKPQENDKKTVYGFLPYWKLEKAEYLHLDKLTDIAYFALHIEANGKIRKIQSDGTTDPGYNNWKNSEELTKLIELSKKSDVNLALTIVSHEDDVSDKFLACTACWTTLVNEIKTELKYRKIKDVNLDFEYVEYPQQEQTVQYTQFINYLNTELDKEFGESTLTVSTFADSSIRPRITDPGELAKVADKLFIMAYDFHYPNSDRAGPVAPVNKVEGYTSYDLNTMLKDYLKTISPNKLILGVPYYGYNWVVESSQPYAPRIKGNDYIGYSMSQTYEDLVDTIIEVKPNIEWDTVAQVPYFTYLSPSSGVNRMVYFENPDSLKIKYRLVKDYNLDGVGIWALGYDGGYQELWALLDSELIL